MTATDEKPITTFQIKRIMQNCSYQMDTKNEWVQWVTEDVNRTSLKSITHDQAIKIMHAQTGSPPTPKGGANEQKSPFGGWGAFDKTNPKHKVILSLMYQMQWTKPSVKWGDIPDLDKLNTFLHSDRCPVQKPLKDMNLIEIQKIIKALNGIIKHTYK